MNRLSMGACVMDDQDHALRVNGSLVAEGHDAIKIKRGAGSGFLAGDWPEGHLVYAPSMGGLGAEKTVALEAGTAWMQVGGVVYVNGTEVFRSPNMPSGPIDYDTRTVGSNGENTIDRATFDAGLLESGPNVVAVEIHQADPDSSDVSFDLSLTGVAPPPSPTLRWAWLSGELVLWWGDDAFQLLHAPNITGPWTLLPDASSPWVLPPQQAQDFFRLIKP